MFEEIEKYKSLDFFARQVVEGFITGLHKSPFHGFSVEFAEHRLYNAGESTRHIDWKLFGRTDKLFVKRYEEETNLRCAVALDCSSSMLYPLDRHACFPDRPNKLTFSVYAAALLIELLERQRDAFSLVTFTDNLDLQTDMRSSTTHQRHLYALLQQLLSAAPQQPTGKPTDVATCLHQLAEQLHRRSVVVVFTDAMSRDDDREALFDALRHLRHNKHEVLLFHVTEGDTERDFHFDNRPYEFVDMETGERVKLFPQEVAEAYRRRRAETDEDLRRHAMQSKIDYVEVDTTKGFEQVMLPFLLKRSRHY